MFFRQSTLLDFMYDKALREMNRQEFGSAEYNKALTVVTKLHELREKERNATVSKDTLAMIGANLLGIFMIIQHENVNVITSKALGFVMRPR